MERKNMIHGVRKNDRPKRKETCRTRIMTFIFISAWAIIVSFPSFAGDRLSPAGQMKPPKLVLMIVIDQLRGDMMPRLRSRFSQGGFRYLMDHGIWYADANYRHATTLTAVGHAALYTGGNSAQHGLVANEWLDPVSREFVDAVEDSNYSTLGETTEPHLGTSPRNLTSTTIGDELVLASGKRSRVFSVSLKDRGAIIPAGRLGKAFWFSEKTGRMVTSTYYYQQYPDWISAWNAANPADRYRTRDWTLLRDRASYSTSQIDNPAHDRGYRKLGLTFPHPLGNGNSEDFYETFVNTPFGDELICDFVRELIGKENLGTESSPDMLCISFSSTDSVGHIFGPDSLEYEDCILRIDALLERLFKDVGESLGPDKVLIVLAGDHGVNRTSEECTLMNFPGGRLRPREFIDTVGRALKKRFSTEEPLIQIFLTPYVYLNLETLKKLKLDCGEVEAAAAEELMKVDGVAMAVTRTSLLKGDVPDTPIMKKIQASFHPKRSGNIYVLQDEFTYLYGNSETNAATHGSAYVFDTHVPLFFAGPGIKSGTVFRPVSPEDVASTISLYLGIAEPTGSTGTPLLEVL